MLANFRFTNARIVGGTASITVQELDPATDQVLRERTASWCRDLGERALAEAVGYAMKALAFPHLYPDAAMAAITPAKEPAQ